MSLLSHLAIAGIITASSTTSPVEAPPVPELTPVVSDNALSANEFSSILHAQDDYDVIEEVGNYVLSGVDISSHQHNNGSSIDIKEVVAGGKDFAFVKATEGTHYVNPHFRKDVIDFIESSTPVGFYHYARPTTSTDEAREQAQLFVKVTGLDIGVKSLPPVLDLEEDEGLSSDQLESWTHAFVDEVKELTGRDVMIYTYPNFWLNQMNNSTEFNHLPLWIAHYNNQGQPGTLPGGWEDWVFWQYTSKGVIPGSQGLIDLNIFSGTQKELKEMYQASKDGQLIEQVESVPEPPQIEIVNEVAPIQPDIREITVPEVIAGDLPALKTLMESFNENK